MNHQDLDRDREQRLVAFIRQHRSIAPPPAIDLQQSILAQIQHQAQPHRNISSAKSFKWLWLIPASIVSASMIIWQINRPIQTALTDTDRQIIEASLVTGWSVATSEESESDQLLITNYQ